MSEFPPSPSRQTFRNLLPSESDDRNWFKRTFPRHARPVVSTLIVLIAMLLANVLARYSQILFYELVWMDGVNTLDPTHLNVVTPMVTTFTTFFVAMPLIWYGMRLNRAERQAMHRADAANRAKTNFLAMTSHEIRTPLNGILGMAQVLARSELSEEQRKSLGTMINSAKMLSNQLDDILDLSKVEAGRMTLAPRKTDFIGLIREVHGLWSAQAGLKGLSMTLAIEPDVPQYQLCDPQRVQQCIGNLISNAVKFTRDGGINIRVARRDLGDQAVIEIAIRDSGPGIPADDLDRIFKPFEQTLDSERATPGTGLGLSIANQLAAMMGGRVAAQSMVGIGTTMIFTLPDRAVDAPGVAPAVPGPVHPSAELTGPLNILAVDDSGTNLMVIENILRIEGHAVTTAADADTALKALEEHEFDLVLMDVHMPGTDGIEALSTIRRSGKPWRNVPVIALTADAMSGDRERYMDLGMNGYVTKPIDIDDLAAEIATVMAAGNGQPAGPSG